MLTDNGWATLLAAKRGYDTTTSPFYDEVLREVSSRIAASGSAGKLDIGALTFWKRIRADTPSTASLNTISDADVRAITAVAVATVNDLSLDTAEAAGRARGQLQDLPGYRRGDAVASALLTAAAPARLGVFDQRAVRALGLLGLPVNSRRGQYRRYITTLVGLVDLAGSHGLTWTVRDVDTAPFHLGAPQR